MKARDLRVGQVVVVSFGGRVNHIRWIGTVLEITNDYAGVRGWTQVSVSRPQRWTDLGIFKRLNVRQISHEIDATDVDLLWPWSDTDVAPEFVTVKRERLATLERHRAARAAMEARLPGGTCVLHDTEWDVGECCNECACASQYGPNATTK